MTGYSYTTRIARSIAPYIAAILLGLLVGGMVLVAPLPAVGAVGATLFALLVLRYPVTLCLTLVAAVTLLAGIPRGMFVPGLRVNEALLAASLGLAALIVLTNQHRAVNINRLGGVTAIFIVLVVGTVLIPVIYHTFMGHEASAGALFDVFSPLKFFATFLVFAIIPVRAWERHAIIAAMLACAAIVSVVGLLQAAQFGPVLSFLSTWYGSSHTSAALDGEVGRVTSLVGAWNTLGMVLMMGIAIGWAALRVPELARYRVLIGGSMVLATLCLLASGSFAGIAGLVITILLIERLSSPLKESLKRLLLAAGLIVVGLLLTLPVIWPVVAGRLEYQFGDGELLPQTFVYRFWIWRDVFWPEIVRNPLFGTSLEIGQQYRWLFAESHYISLLFRFGVIGLAAHLLWVGLMLAWLYRRAQGSAPFTRMMAMAGMASLIYLSFAALTNEVFLFTGSIDYLWITFALVANGSTGSLGSDES